MRRCALIIVALLLSAPLPARQQTLSPFAWRQLNAIHEQIDRRQEAAALKSLQALLEQLPPDGYATALALQMLGYVQVDRGDYPAAIRAFDKSLALEQLPETSSQRLRYDLAQLYLATDQPDKAVSMLQTWFREADKPDAEAWLLLGQAWAARKRYRKAIEALQHAIRLASHPRAEWYEALLAMHYELRDYRACVPVLEDLLRLFPERARYWPQLAAVQLAMEDEHAALDTLELAYRDGALKQETELLQLARLYLHGGIPYKGARLLEQEMKRGRIRDTAANRKLLAQAWSASKQRAQAIRALKRALEKNRSPELALQLVRWYFDGRDWKAATDTLRTLTARRLKAKTAAQAWLLLGISYYRQGQLEAAHDAFERAAALAAGREMARQWLEFLDAGTTAQGQRQERGVEAPGAQRGG